MTGLLRICALALVLLSSGVFSACSTSKEKKTAQPPPSEEVTAEVDPIVPADLVIKAASLRIEPDENNPDGPESIALEDSGSVVVKGKTVATLSADGTVVDADGELLARLAADGTLSFPGEKETLTVAADGSVSQAGTRVASIGENNQLVVGEVSEAIVYAGPDEARQAMMVVFLIAAEATQSGEAAEEASDDESASAPMEE